MKNLLGSKWVVVLLLGLMAFSLVGSAALTFGQDDDLEDAPEESITLCGARATVGFFGWMKLFLAMIALIFIVVNVINLIRAKRYWFLGPENIIAYEDYAEQRFSFSDYYFWPKALKAIGVLLLLLGFTHFAIGIADATLVLRAVENPSFQLLNGSVRINFAGLAACFWATLIIFTTYYFFMWMLHWINKKGQQRWLNHLNTSEDSK